MSEPDAAHARHQPVTDVLDDGSRRVVDARSGSGLVVRLPARERYEPKIHRAEPDILPHPWPACTHVGQVRAEIARAKRAHFQFVECETVGVPDCRWCAGTTFPGGPGKNPGRTLAEMSVEEFDRIVSDLKNEDDDEDAENGGVRP